MTTKKIESQHPVNTSEKRELFDFRGSTKDLSKAILLGLAIGDSLGATSEFARPEDVASIKKSLEKKGNDWPLSHAGGGPWAVGEPTDDTDMAMCVLRSYVKNKGAFNPSDITTNFINWLLSRPKDVGFTTRSTLAHAYTAMKSDTKSGDHKASSAWYSGGAENYRQSPGNAANGSLMRNAPVAVYSLNRSTDDAIEETLLHGIITHFSPVPVLTCVLQTVLLRKALQATPGSLKAAPTMADIKSIFDTEWKQFKDAALNSSTQSKFHPATVKWFTIVGKTAIEQAEKKMLEELSGFDTFDPFTYNYKGVSGYCTLSLKIALWSLYWSFKIEQGQIPAVPEWFEGKETIFKISKGFEAVYLVVLIGADSDTYGAIAGPLLAAYHPVIPAQLVTPLFVLKEVESSL